MDYLPLKDVIEPVFGTRIVQRQEGGTKFPVYGGGGITFHADSYNREDDLVIARFAMSKHCVRFIKGKFFLNDSGLTIKVINTKFSQEFIQWYLLGQQELVYNCSRGAAQRNIDMSRFLSLKVPILKKSEQDQIVSFQKKVTVLLEKRRQSIAKLDQLAQSIFLDMFGDPVTNPKKLQSKSLLDVCKLYSGATPNTRDESYWEGEVPWFSPKDLKKDDLWDSIDHISQGALAISKIKMLPKDTVVIVVRGMILAHTFPVTVLRVEGTINQDVKALLPQVDINPQFLASCIRAQRGFILKQVSEAGHGTKRLDSEGLKKIKILLPSIDLQKKFESAVEKIHLQKSYNVDSLNKLMELQQSLSQKFFGN